MNEKLEIAILMAAGLGTRMRPITDKIPKPLVRVHGKPMIETVIEGLIERGVSKFYVVTGYLADQFAYLEQKYEGIQLVENRDYLTVNNISSIKAISDILVNTHSNVFICEADLYVNDSNIFKSELKQSCYFGKMVQGHSDDWVFDVNNNGRITRVGKVGDDQYNMVGISWFMKEDANKLGDMIEEAYGKDGFENLFWDDVVNHNLDKLDLTVHEVESGQLVEIDTVQELMEIDHFYKQYSMDAVLDLIENTVNKSSIQDFRSFISKFSDVTKWILCSDYCIEDKNKPNNVMSFVLYPYIFDINQWQEIIKNLQPKDIKNSSHITENFRKFTHLGLFFSFNIVFDKNGTIFDAWKNKDVLISLVDQYIEMMDTWKVNTPHRKELYNKYQKHLKKIRNDMNAKNFNVKLFHRTVVTVLFASYIRYLLVRESNKIEIYSWLSDRDNITSLCDGIYSDLYAIISHCICAQKLDAEKYKGITEALPINPKKEFFWDILNRVPDVICGVLADHNLSTNEVSKGKHIEGVEDILSDNQNIVVLYMDGKGIGRVHYTKESS